MIDFTAMSPSWLGYFVYEDEYSNKFYEARVDEHPDGSWYLSKRWGRRPDADHNSGQKQQEQFDSRAAAIQRARKITTEKQAKGYESVPWPHGVVEAPIHDRERLEQWLSS